MKIVIFGAGGVGGYFGGKLVNQENEVTFIARGKHLEAIKHKGLQVKSIDGDFTVYPKVTDDISTISNPDLIILGVKSWQITEVAKLIKPILGKNTMVLPLQNGADNADKLLSVLPKRNVLVGLCRIVSKVEDYGVINHFAFKPEIVFGEYDNQLTNRIKKVKKVFDVAGFSNTISKDIHLDVWKKYLFIATISGIASLTRQVFGMWKKDEVLRKIMIDTANEIVKIANAKGINLSQKNIQKTMDSFDKTRYNTTASMQRDIMEGKPSELENFNGYIVEQGKLLGISTPINSFIYHSLLPQENIAREKG